MSLSDKIKEFNVIGEYLIPKHVKEAVKKLKAVDLIKCAENREIQKESFNINEIFREKIDQVFGDKLI